MNLLIDYQIHVQDCSVPTYEQVQTWAEVACAHLADDKEVSIRVVDTEEMTHFNETFRKKSGPTNVLSFPEEVEPFEPPSNYLGDIAICADVVEREAKDQKKDLMAHWAHMVVHGLLHLLGYDHLNTTEAEVMEKLETDILFKLGFNNPYEYDQE